MPPAPDPTQRFSNRVEDYVRHRPGYPPELVATLEREAGLGPSSVVADLGSGTGISAELFLDAAATVFAVEPNSAMRRAAEALQAEELTVLPGAEEVLSLLTLRDAVVCLLRQKADTNGEGILDQAPATALPHGILFLTDSMTLIAGWILQTFPSLATIG